MNHLRDKLKKPAIIACSSLLAFASVRSFFMAAAGGPGSVFNLVFGILLLGLVVAVFRRYRWALRLAAVLCILVAIVLPAGLFSPFTAGDYMAGGKEPPSVALTLLWLIPLEALLLAIVLIIDPRKTDP